MDYQTYTFSITNKTSDEIIIDMRGGTKGDIVIQKK